MKKLLFYISIFFVVLLVSCDKAKVENEELDKKPLLVNFKEDSIVLKLSEKNDYQFEYTTNKECEINLKCDKNEGYTLENEKVTFTEKGEYKFTITANDKEMEATDSMVIFVLDNDEPKISGYEENIDYDFSNGAFELKYEVSPSFVKTIITCDKEIEIVDGKINFLNIGLNKLTITAMVGDYQSKAEINVNVYNIFNLSGLGTEEEPWEVKTVNDLEMIKEVVLEDEKDLTGKYFIQKNDIDLDGINWTPIGTIGLPFRGIYNGNDYTIKNLNINSSESFQGFFGFLTGIVTNLTVKGEIVVTTEGIPYSHSLAGGIAGGMNNGAKIINCTNYVNITADSSAGGIVGEILETDYYLCGEVFSEVISCTNYGKIVANFSNAKHENVMYFGGITGKNHGKIYGCANYGVIDAYSQRNETTKSNDYVGGIAGYSFQPFYSGFGPNDSMDYAAIENSRNEGKVSGVHAVGGIVGQHALRIVNCENFGNVKGDKSIGGIAGISGTEGTANIGYTSINKCKNSGSVSSTNSYAGGIAGYVYNDIIECENYADVLSSGTEAKSIGGIAGLSKGLTDKCKNTGKVTGLCYVAGIVGNAQNGTTSNCINEGIIIATATSSAVCGGIIGDNNNNKILNCTNKGSVEGISNTGGIVGRLKGKGYEVNNCHSLDSAVIQGDNNLGGIAGRIEATSTDSPIVIIDCSNSSTVTGVTGYCGGIVGMHGSYNLVTSCVNNGKVSAKGYNSTENIGVGGISGQLFHSSKVSNCTNNGEVVGERVTGGIVGSAKPDSAKPFEISNCINSGNVTCNYIANKDAWVGGILGYGTNGSIVNSINNGEIVNTNGAKYVNDICGKTSKVTITSEGGEANA